MNYLRTAVLLAGLTALFMAVGYLLGGGTGAVIALLFAAATNLFSYWNSDKLVLSMHDAQEVDETVRVSTSSVQDQSTQCNPATTDTLPRLSMASGAGSCGCRGISNWRKVRFADVSRVISRVRRLKIVVDLCGPSTRSNCSAASQRTRSRTRGCDGKVTS